MNVVSQKNTTIPTTLARPDLTPLEYCLGLGTKFLPLSLSLSLSVFGTVIYQKLLTKSSGSFQ